VEFEQERLTESGCQFVREFAISFSHGVPPPRNGDGDVHVLLWNAIHFRDPDGWSLNVCGIVERPQYLLSRLFQQRGGVRVAHDNDRPVALVASVVIGKARFDLSLSQLNQFGMRVDSQNEFAGVRFSGSFVVAHGAALVGFSNRRVLIERQRSKVPDYGMQPFAVRAFFDFLPSTAQLSVHEMGANEEEGRRCACRDQKDCR
jgi:hypothetical protein